MVDAALIGLIAGLLTTGSQFPQAWKIYKTKSAGDLSAICILVLLAGTVFWFYYGLLKNDLPVMFWNGTSIFTVGFIAVYKFNIIKTKTVGSGMETQLSVRTTDQMIGDIN